MKYDCFKECAMWMETFLTDHIVIRSSYTNPSSCRPTKIQVNLFSASDQGKLLWFRYSSCNFPAANAFQILQVSGDSLQAQIQKLMEIWEMGGLHFWTIYSQAAVLELTSTSAVMANSPCSLDMLFVYHRMLACLETNPVLEGTKISEVITAYKRLKGFLDEQSKRIQYALIDLGTVING